MKNTKKGFTLIELLVVIAIIGILASVVLASLNSARKKGRDARRVADIKQVQLALELYFDAMKNYPQALGGTGNLVPAYLPAEPKDPLTGASYNYAVNAASAASTYHLGATLEESTNPALSSDRDCTSLAAGCFAGAATSGGFNGAGAGTNGDDATTPVYDLTP
ncbi:MAG: type II secretion system protein [Candidatus Niyogibacteria bacterium]|nr:type II secretion system protein [Candidatus Niyogibacteria bacterium]